MAELERVAPKKVKAPEKPASKKRRLVRGIAAGATAAVAAVAVKRVLANPLAKSRMVIPEDSSAIHHDETKAAVRKHVLLLKQSLSPEQVAQMLAMTEPSVLRRIRARSLYGFPFGKTWRVPTFQFRGGALLRGVEKVLPRLDAGLHPLEVINWFSLRHSDLVMSGKPVSPATWLERGGDVESVAELAAEVGTGL